MKRILAGIVPGYQEAAIVMTACRLDIFNTLGEKPSAARDLASRLNLKPKPAEILLDALVALGLLAKKKEIYSLNAFSSRYLAVGGDEYLGDLYLHQERMLRYWSGLRLKIMKEPSAADEEETVGEERDFVMAMETNARRLGKKIIAMIDLSGVRNLLDLGGGPATYSRMFLDRSPDMRVTVFDRPSITGIAGDIESNRAYGSSLRFIGGDFLKDDLLGRYDMIWASNVIHSLCPRDAAKLVERCFIHLAPAGRLLLHDFFLDRSGTRPRRAAVFSVHMLVATDGGRSYRKEEVVRLMRDKGYKNVRQSAVFESSSIIEGRRS